MRKLVTGSMFVLALSGPLTAQAAPPTSESIKQQALGSEGFARALGKTDPDPSRAPIDASAWDRLDIEVRAVNAAELPESERSTDADPNLRPQYLVLSYKAREDLYVIVSMAMGTDIIRRIVPKGEVAVVVADVTPTRTNGEWQTRIEWRNRLPSGQPRAVFKNAVLSGSPEEKELLQKQKQMLEEANAKAQIEIAKQAEAMKAADKARGEAEARQAKADSEDQATLKATVEPVIGKWIPYTRIDYHADGTADSDYRAIKIDRYSDGKGVATMLMGGQPASPRVQVGFTIEGGTLNLKDENCPVKLRPAREKDRVYMMFGTRSCYAMQQQIAIIPEERDLEKLDVRKMKGVSIAPGESAQAKGPEPRN